MRVTDLEQEIVQRVTKHCGWTAASCKIEADKMTVQCESGQLLVLRLPDFKEVYGRIRHIGFTASDLLDLRQKIDSLER